MIFLADADEVFKIFMTLVFGFIAFMGWVGQFMKNKQQGAKRAAPRQQNDGQVQNEIERFLQEVTGQKKAQPQQQQRPAAPPRRPPKRPKPPVARQEQESSWTGDSQPRRVAAKKEQRRQSTATRQPTPPPAPSSRDAFIPPRATASAASRGRDVVTTLGANLAAELRDPAAIRRAIVLNMILGPPKSREKQSDS